MMVLLRVSTLVLPLSGCTLTCTPTLWDNPNVIEENVKADNSGLPSSEGIDEAILGRLKIPLN